jgi:hypothetical protein
MRASYAEAAARRRLEETLICASCRSANRDGETAIDLGRDGLAVCRVCGTEWAPQNKTANKEDR